MKRLVVDASVAGKWFSPEEGSREAAELLNGKWELLAPDLIVAEFGNLVWKKVRRKEVPAPQAEGMLRTFLRLPLLLHPATQLAGNAWPIAVESGLTFYDSLYLALAARERCKLVTVDRKILESLKGSKLEAVVEGL